MNDTFTLCYFSACLLYLQFSTCGHFNAMDGYREGDLAGSKDLDDPFVVLSDQSRGAEQRMIQFEHRATLGLCRELRRDHAQVEYFRNIALRLVAETTHLRDLQKDIALCGADTMTGTGALSFLTATRIASALAAAADALKESIS